MLQDGRWKLHPLFDWSNRDLHQYLLRHQLPYHPLWNDGYVSIGDRHSTRPIHEVAREEDTRFAGLIRECGLHERNEWRLMSAGAINPGPHANSAYSPATFRHTRNL